MLLGREVSSAASAKVITWVCCALVAVGGYKFTWFKFNNPDLDEKIYAGAVEALGKLRILLEQLKIMATNNRNDPLF